MDNNIIELLKKTTFVAPDTIFAVYDAILIPGWVYEEVQDSDGRVKYIEDLGGRLNKHIYIIKVNY